MSVPASAYAFLAGAIAAEVAGTTFLQKSEQFTKLLPSLATAGLYALAFFLLSIALKHMPLAVAYAIWSGVGIVLTAIIGAVLFRQMLDLPAMIGIGLIVSGVVVAQLFSRTLGHG
ncbi:QacE family quaternary ammonium compound efflux SMR transporter [Caulobacter radicis]|uniref:DMT family transporter n=1 Tax=Caulobacter radicis TaxID=2172650 RepID=UPI000D5659D8|nr:multidrug efflux SMR transporter [Caulobacter radicis]PVM86043.1 QacE family quaternary ammonium compound efflux SMR transporter [Caulobacter radicis]